jgi:predicted HAD superfamily Cof-like phosphohydrolase
MSHYLESVEEFHNTFNHPVEEEIKEDNFELRKLRLSLIFEEMVELAHAMGVTEHLENLCSKHTKGNHNWLYNGDEPGVIETHYNKIETLDALCDLQYVLSGGILSLGYKNIFDESFDRVHQSNMSKMCEEDQIEDTIEYHKSKGETQKMNPIEKNGKFIIVREDGKVMKNKYYQPVDLSQFI